MITISSSTCYRAANAAGLPSAIIGGIFTNIKGYVPEVRCFVYGFSATIPHFISAMELQFPKHVIYLVNPVLTGAGLTPLQAGLAEGPSKRKPAYDKFSFPDESYNSIREGRYDKSGVLFGIGFNPGSSAVFNYIILTCSYDLYVLSSDSILSDYDNYRSVTPADSQTRADLIICPSFDVSFFTKRPFYIPAGEIFSLPIVGAYARSVTFVATISSTMAINRTRVTASNLVALSYLIRFKGGEGMTPPLSYNQVMSACNFYYTYSTLNTSISITSRSVFSINKFKYSMQ